jgi:flagellar basal-body rod protein FlgG
MMDATGRIVNPQGNVVQPTITIPTNATSITINPQGQVSVTIPGSTTPSLLGQLTLTTFVNKAGLQSIGDNLFVETPASGTPTDNNPTTNGAGDLQQGNLEQANVEAVTEISDLISAQRAYEMNAKVVTAADQMLQSAANMMR